MHGRGVVTLAQAIVQHGHESRDVVGFGNCNRQLGCSCKMTFLEFIGHPTPVHVDGGADAPLCDNCTETEESILILLRGGGGIDMRERFVVKSLNAHFTPSSDAATEDAEHIGTVNMRLRQHETTVSKSTMRMQHTVGSDIGRKHGYRLTLLAHYPATVIETIGMIVHIIAAKQECGVS